MIRLDETVIWKQLSGPYGNSEEIPPLIADLAETNKKEIADQLIWEYLYHQGTVYECTLASIPHLLKIANESSDPDFKLDLILSLGTVLIGLDVDSNLDDIFHEDMLRENLKYRIKTAFKESIVAFKTLVADVLPQAKLADEASKRWYLVARLAADKRHKEAEVFNTFNENDEYMFVCPSCEEETFLWNEDNVLNAYDKDPVNDNKKKIDLRVDPSSTNLDWLEDIVDEINIESIKPLITYFNGNINCYRCTEESNVFEGIVKSIS